MTFYEELEWRGVVVYEGIVDMRSADVAAEQLKPLHGGGDPACCSGGLRCRMPAWRSVFLLRVKMPEWPVGEKLLYDSRHSE